MSIRVEFQTGPDVQLPGNGDKQQNLSAKDAFAILSKVSDADVKKLGLNPKYARPEWFLVTVLPVPPQHVRPEVAVEGQPSAPDDLTQALINIIKANLKLQG